MSEAPQRHERVLESRHLYRGRILNLRLDTVAMPSGHVAAREVVEHSDTVAIVALDGQGNALLARRGELRDAKSIIGLLLAAGESS